MRFTIIGAAGYLGRALTTRLSALGMEVCAPAKGEMPAGPLGRVIYAAGVTRDFLADPTYTLRAHATDFANMLKLDFEHCWYLSSVRLYDHTGLGEVDENSPITVNVVGGRSVFDTTKLAGEAMALHASGGRAGIARLACVHGGDTSTPAFIHELMEKARKGETASGSHPEITRDYIHLDEVCRALTADQTPSGIINFSSGRNVTNAEIFSAVESACGHRFSHKGPLPGYRPPPRIDNSRFVRTFGFQPMPLTARIPHLFPRPDQK